MYSVHCKDWLAYQKWLKERNENRFTTNKAHGQDYDSKNIMHVVRLMNTAREIAETGRVRVRRLPKEVSYLLSIKSGQEDLGKLVEWAQKEALLIKDLFAISSLPDDVDKTKCHELIIKLRK